MGAATLRAMSFPDQPPPLRRPTVKTSPATTAWIVAGIIGAVLLPIAVVAGFSIYGSITEDRRDNEAIAVCHQDIAERLRAVGHFWGGDKVEAVDKTRVKVTGTVRTDTGRRDFTCEVDEVGDGWRVTSSQLLN